MTESTKRRILPEDLYNILTVSKPRISPDGSKVVYSVQRIDQKTEKKYCNLWMAPTCCGDPRQFTVGDQTDSTPNWSPDGTQIAFLSNRENAEMPPQLYIIPVDGGESRQVCEIEGMIKDFSWSPNGQQILCTIVKTDAETLERMSDEKKKKLGVVARHYDRVRFKYDGFGFLPKEQAHLWLVNPTTGETTQLTDDPVYAEGDAAWSPNGESIVYVSNRSERPDFEPAGDGLFMLNLVTNETTKLVTPYGSKSLPSCSPDGKLIAYFGVEGEYTWHETNYLWVISVDGSTAAMNLTKDTDYTCVSSTANDTSSAEQMPPTWANDSSTVYFQVDYHGSTKVMGVNTKNSELFDVIEEGGTAGSFNFSEDQQLMVFSYATLDRLTEVHLLDLASDDQEVITHHNDLLLEELDLGFTEEVWFKGPDENDLQGWILFPPEFDPSKQYASILEIHGGPTAQYGKAFMHEFYTLAAKDYIVYYTNPRGGTGYGDAHCKAIWGDWGNRDFADLMTWSDIIEQKAYIDPKRMGVTGGSYGGYMSVWIIGHTDRYQAAVSQRCVSNLISMWGSSDGNWVFQQIFGNRAPFEDVDVFWKHSPIAFIGNAKTPTMIIHSENDMRCPIEQSEQVFVALKYLNVPTEMVRFPDESHGLSRGGRTDRRVVRLNDIGRWFDTYLIQ